MGSGSLSAGALARAGGENNPGLWGNSFRAEMVTSGKAAQTNHMRHSHSCTRHLLYTNHCPHIHTHHRTHTAPGLACLPKERLQKRADSLWDSVCLGLCAPQEAWEWGGSHSRSRSPLASLQGSASASHLPKPQLLLSNEKPKSCSPEVGKDPNFNWSPAC